MSKQNPYESCLCLATRRLSRVLTQDYDAALAVAGLKVTQFSLLAALDKAGEGKVRLSVIAEALDMEPSSLTRALSPLTRAGFIAFEAGEDRRERMARLTPAGRAKLAEAMPLWADAQARAMTKLGDAAPGMLGTLLGNARGVASSTHL